MSIDSQTDSMVIYKKSKTMKDDLQLIGFVPSNSPNLEKANEYHFEQFLAQVYPEGVTLIYVDGLKHRLVCSTYLTEIKDVVSAMVNYNSKAIT